MAQLQVRRNSTLPCYVFACFCVYVAEGEGVVKRCGMRRPVRRGIQVVLTLRYRMEGIRDDFRPRSELW